MAYAPAKTIAASEIPVIDIAALYAGDPAGTAAVVAAMRRAAETVGFFYIRNHGISDAILAATEGMAHRFFRSPNERKAEVAVRDYHRGYLKIGEAKMYGGAKVDLKESFIWGREIAPDDPDFLAGNRMTYPNRWPSFLPEMREVLGAFFDAGNACGRRMLMAFAASLGVDETTFVSRFDKPVSRGSIIYYPPQPPDMGQDQFGVAPHTDYGCLTLLHQDSAGGLQVRNREGDWVTAHPIPGTLVVNVGDLLQRWTNDRFRSTPHRVVNRSGRERFSMAVFVDPNWDAPVTPVAAPGDKPRYETVTCAGYILSRYDDTFAYRNEASGKGT